MRILDRIAVILCIVSITGVLLWSGVVLITFYASGAARASDLLPPEYFVSSSFDKVFGESLGFVLYQLMKGPMFIWMLVGTVGTFLCGIYFAISAKKPFSRTLTVLCFLNAWVFAVVIGTPGLRDWFFD